MLWSVRSDAFDVLRWDGRRRNLVDAPRTKHFEKNPRQQSRETVVLTKGQQQKQQNRGGSTRELGENEGLFKVLGSTWLDATSDSTSTSSDQVRKCRHPHTGEVILFLCSDDKDNSDGQGDSSTEKLYSIDATCQPTGSPTTLEPTPSPPTTNAPTPEPTLSAKPTGKKPSVKKKKQTRSPTANHHEKTSETKSPKRSKKHHSYVDLELPVCPTSSIDGSPNEPTPAPAGTSSSNPNEPTPTGSTASYCDDIAAGTGTPGAHGLTFRIEGVFFATQELTDYQFTRIESFLQQGVAPDTVGCTVDWESLFDSMIVRQRRQRRQRSLAQDEGDSDMSSIQIQEFVLLNSGEGDSCGEDPPNSNDFCTRGYYDVEVTTDDTDALRTYQARFLASLQENVNDAVLQHMGLTGIAPASAVTIVSGGNNPDNTETGGGGDNDNDQQQQKDDTGDVAGGGSNIAAAERIEPLGGSSLKAGPFIAVAFAGIALCVVLVIAANRRYYPSIAASLRHYQFKEFEGDGNDDDTSIFADELSASSSTKKAIVAGDNESQSWQGSQDQTPPIYAAPVDDNGFPAPIEEMELELHPPDENCSSPNCQQCENRRQQATVRFISVPKRDTNDDRPLGPPANRRLAERNYRATDTVEL